MSYDDIVTYFIEPPPTPISPPTLPQTPARRLRDAVEPIATQGWWSRPASEQHATLGIGFFDAYVWGRAAALGTPTASVVVATFGVFEPAMLTAVYERAVASASRDDILAARAAGAIASLGSIVSDDEAAAVADPLLAALGTLDGMGRPLFSALRELPMASTAAGRLWRAAELVREHRGDGHLAACVAEGLTAIDSNILTELWLDFAIGEYSGTRGFGPDRVAAAVARLEGREWVADGALTEAGRTVRDRVEAATDASEAALVAALGDECESIIANAEAIAERVMSARAFPHDPRKRAAG